MQVSFFFLFSEMNVSKYVFTYFSPPYLPIVSVARRKKKTERKKRTSKPRDTVIVTILR